MEFDKLCMGCMKERSNTGKCEFCGYDESTEEQDQRVLSPRTILNGQYLVGKVLGQGGFGITYLAYDLNLSFKVAIKEYLPDGLATRSLGNTTVSVFTNEKRHNFEYGLERFLEEAQVMAKFNNVPSIVSVRNFFRENGTAYFVMDFVEGMSLSEYLKHNGGKLPYEEAEKIALKVADALDVVHKEGLIHRDIAPDNVYLTSDGNIKLMDFGAARFAMGEHNKTLSIILKPGYAPEEQYRTKGQQGPWTDIYALGAMLYKMITGETPPPSVDRLYKDELTAPSKLIGGIPANVEQTILNSLEVNSDNRIKSISDFKKSLEGTLPIEPRPVIPQPQPQPQPQPSYPQDSQLNSIYNDYFPLNTLSDTQKECFTGNGFNKTYPSVLAVLLHILTFGFSSAIIAGAKHSKLPKIKSDDFGSGKAIGLLFVPFFNIYWIFMVYLRLADRLNLQFRLRGKRAPISKGLVITMLVLNLIPFVNFISLFIIGPICIAIIQGSCNTLAKEKDSRPSAAPITASIIVLALCAVLIPLGCYQIGKLDTSGKPSWEPYNDSASYDESIASSEESTAIDAPAAVNPDDNTGTGDDNSSLLINTIESDDKNFMFSVPEGWKKTSGLNDEAQIQMVNSTNDCWIMSLSEKKEIFSSSFTLDDYRKLLQDHIRSGSADVVFSEIENITVGENNAQRFTAQGTVSGIKVTYLITLVDSPNYYSQLTGWTYTFKFDQKKELMEDIEDTFDVD